MELSNIVSLLTNGMLTIHIAAGFSALALFWVPVFTRKGGLNHRKVGMWYVNCMWVVVVSAAVLSVKNAVTGEYVGAIFLGYLALITAKPLWLGVIILKNKREMSLRHHRVSQALSIMTTVGGIGLIVTGYVIREHSMAIVLIIFGLLGLTSISDFINQSKNQQSSWIKQHIVGMCTSGIAAHTAFMVFGASRFIQDLFSNSYAWIPWVLPSIIGTIGIIWAEKKYDHSHKRTAIN